MIHLRTNADPLAQRVVVLLSALEINWIKFQME